ncbi:MAG: hypothetical protein COA91_08540 [Robiginitomaculum sp.]|nr:MAG: hypothetical protein COA91_08540 [Robiginitomaculum sp.]
MGDRGGQVAKIGRPFGFTRQGEFQIGGAGFFVEAHFAVTGGTGLEYTAVDEHMADQLLVPMALFGGGMFTTTNITLHTRTNRDIIRRFLDVNINFTQSGRKCWMVEVDV